MLGRNGARRTPTTPVKQVSKQAPFSQVQLAAGLGLWNFSTWCRKFRNASYYDPAELAARLPCTTVLRTPYDAVPYSTSPPARIVACWTSSRGDSKRCNERSRAALSRHERVKTSEHASCPHDQTQHRRHVLRRVRAPCDHGAERSDGVVHVDIDLPKNEAVVDQLLDRVNETDLIAAISNAGYRASVVASSIEPGDLASQPAPARSTGCCGR